MQKQKRPPLTPPAAARPASGHSDAWRLDPSDVARHAQLRRRSEEASPLAKAVRYLAVVVALGGAFAVYWNFDSLRQVTVQAPALSAVFKSLASDEASVRTTGAPDSAVVESTAVAGTAAPTTMSAARNSERPLEITKPAEPATPAPKPRESSVAERAPAIESASAERVATAGEPVESASPRQSVATATAAVEPAPPPAPETIAFALPKFTASERDAFAAVIVVRNGGKRGASVFTWWTSDGTAAAGKDYVDLGRVVVKFASGEQSRAIHIPIVGDEVAEGPESFYVNLAAGDDASAEPQDRVEVVIEDDD